MVDILMAVYNGEKYLEKQLQSIEKQTYKNWRLIIRDDGSTDGSMKIAERFCHRFEPGKVLLFKNDVPSGSAKKNFMRLLQDSEAEYTMFADQDDYWLENKVKLSLAVMRRAERENGKKIPILVHSDLYVTDAELNVISQSFFDYQKLPRTVKLNQLIVQNSVTGCTVMMNRVLRDYLKAAGDADKIVMHDYFAALIAGVFGKIIFIRRPLIKYRQHGDNSVGASRATSFKYLKQRLVAGKKQFRQRMEDTMIQVDYFNQLYKEKLSQSSYRSLLEQYAVLSGLNKKQRMHFYIKNKALKYGTIRKIMQIIWS